MEDAVDRGQPFEFSELWRPSTFPVSSFAEHDALAGLELPALDKSPHNAEPQTGPFDFELLQLDDPVDEVFPEPPALEQDGLLDEALPLDSIEPHLEDDLWNLDAAFLSPKKFTSYCTWEAFEKKEVTEARDPAYLSEAGADAFDAAMSQRQTDHWNGVLPQNVSLRALCNVALGRPSILYQWNATKTSLEPTLPEIPISGLNLQCSKNFTTALMEYGAMYRKLLAISAPRKIEKTSTLMALKRCNVEILDAVELYIFSGVRNVRSLLQLQATIEMPRRLVSTLMEIVDIVKDADTEEKALSIIGDRVYAIVESGSSLVSVLRTMLARVSLPWLRLLQEDLGLVDGTMAEEPPVGVCRALESFEAVSSVDTSSHLPSTLINDVDRRLIMDTKTSLDIARKHLDLSYGNPSTHTDGPQKPGRPHNSATSDATEKEEWFREEAQTFCLEDLDARVDRHPETAEQHDDLMQATAATLADVGAVSTYGVDGPALPLHFDPLEELRPAIQTQWRELNDRLLRYVFQDCELRKHLDIQHSFHLLGSGGFVTKISTALLSSDPQSAERTRDNMPTGAAMGLRLEARTGQRWPPASSELRLSLMGVLDDAYRTGFPEPNDVANKRADLPGGLSFAIRELSDAEIDRVMVPTSLHALDFLRLQYTAPTPLDAIITSASVLKYDEIFRFLLQLLRVSYVTTSLRKDTVKRPSNDSSAAHRTSLELHHVVSAIVTYVIHIGVSAPWTAFLAQITQIEQALLEGDVSGPSKASVATGLSSLREMHDACLESIRSRLFRKRKQARIRSAIEDVLTSVLETAPAIAARLQHEPSRQKSSSFRASVTKLVDLLQETVDKPPKAMSHEDITDHEADAVKVLLGQLNWNHSYTNTT